MKKILVSACAFLAGASLLLGSVVTNTATEFVPWGDQYRLRLIETIGNVIGQLDNPTPATLSVSGKLTANGETSLKALDCDSVTVDAASGIDTAEAGELKIGTATATSVTVGDSGTTVEIKSSGWSISTAGVIANAAMSADQLTAGSTASAISGEAITNLAAGNIASGTLSNDRLDTDLQALAVNNGGSLTNIGDSSINADAISASKLATAVQTSLGKADSALQPNTVVVTGVTNGVDTAVLTVTNGLGAASTIVGIWSATSNGAASTDNLISLVATTGTLLSSTNSGTIVVITDSTGYAELTATVSAASTNYVAFVQNDGVRKSSAEMVFDGP